MKDFKFIIKEKITSNSYLRNLRNSYRDYRSIAKYRLGKLMDSPKKEPTEQVMELTSEEVEKRYQSILDKNSSFLSLKEFDTNSPLVSIIIINRNGLSQLKKLFKNFWETAVYPNYEFIMVDNASTDGSVQFLRELSPTIPICIMENTRKMSFFEANNHAVEIAKGEFLLFLDSSVEPTYGWLNQMMQVTLRGDEIGAVGAKLVRPYILGHNNSFKILNMGIVFHDEDGNVKPYNRGEGIEPFDTQSNKEKILAAVTSSAMLVRRDVYQEVGGLDQRYDYGTGDVDFCLKLYHAGYKNIYCPQALLFHNEPLTQGMDINHTKVKGSADGEELFQQKWGEWLRKKLLRDKFEGEEVFSDHSLKVAMVVTEVGKKSSAGDYFTASELGSSLEKLGWDVTFKPQEGPGNWYHLNDDVDVVISFLEAYDPGKIMCNNQSLIKIAWARNWFERWVNNPSIKKFDLIFTSSVTAGKFIKERTGIDTFLLPIATNLERFNDSIKAREEFKSDYCFTGSYWDDPRDIIDMLDPDSLPFSFRLYGKNWDSFQKFKAYYYGFLDYSHLPEVYASTKIVIDDVNRGSKKFGAINSRVFDALASGTLVITNGEIGAMETFEGKLPFYSSKEDLNMLIKYYLTNQEERNSKIKELQELVKEKHTYQIRAKTLKGALEKKYNL